MKLEDIVCDFEYAERLSNLKLSFDSIYKYDYNRKLVQFGECYLHTYTVAELGEMLPREIHIAGRATLFSKVRQSGRFDIAYYYNGVCLAPSVTERLDSKEANARAKLLIWLIENNHITAEKLNNGKN